MFKVKFIIVVVGLIVLAMVASNSVSNFKKDQASLDSKKGTGVLSDSANLKTPNLFQTILGFGGEKTFLILFLNNTEIRPGGGFIGSYGVVKIKNGVPDIIKIEGTEILDYSTANTGLPPPPAPLKKYLKVDKWYFRDANWSPDFSLSAQKALELYKLENGVFADVIDGVIGITPTVLEGLLKIVGPITIDGKKVDDTNVLEEIQYEVEYGYADKGVSKKERKSILSVLASDLLKRTRNSLLTHWRDYYDLVTRLIAEKQIMFFATDVNLQAVFSNQKWSGEVSKTTGDYLQWVDANLGALKTDRVIVRNLIYTIDLNQDGDYLATVAMVYKHKGGIDWRTSQYLSYPRVFVPAGSELISSVYQVSGQKAVSTTEFAAGMENGKQWFGAFVDIKPKQIATLSFTYRLPKNIVSNGSYKLTAQKQLGLNGVGLTLNLNFGKPISESSPEGMKNSIYRQETDLQVDRSFYVKLAP